MSPIDRQSLVEIEYPAAITDLTKVVNTDVKWNFVVRYFVKTAMTNMDEKTFFEWIKTPTQLFENIPRATEESFAVPSSVSNCYTKVHKLARDILLPRHQQTESYKQNLVDGFKNAGIHSFVDNLEDYNEFVERIRHIIPQFTITNNEDRLEFAQQFANLFMERENQVLGNEEIEYKIRTMFEVLQEDPRISPGRFAEQIRGLWNFPTDGAQSILVNLSELFVRYNPYRQTIEDILFDAIENNNSMKLIDKSLIYRFPNHPFSFKIARVEIKRDSGQIGEIKFTSQEGLKADLRLNKEKKEIISLAFDWVTQTELETFISNGDFNRVFQIETKTPINGIENPFELNNKYTIKIKTGKSRIGTNYTDYIFKSVGESRPYTITFKVWEGYHYIDITNTKNNNETIKQDVSWQDYQNLFVVLTVEEKKYTITGTGENRLDARLISLSTTPLATEGAVKKALKEKDQYKTEILAKIIQNYRQNDPETLRAFQFINSQNYQIPNAYEMDKALPEELFAKLFPDNHILFHRLCNNQYIKAEYNKKEGDILTLPLKRKFAFELLHEAQVLILAYIEPKDQLGNQDLIKQLCQAAHLAQQMKGAFAIPFIGPTGSGKSATVSYMMGAPMEEFEDEFGEKRIRQKEQVDGIPKIGFALGLSETIHANSFKLLPPPSVRTGARNRFDRGSQHYPEFLNGLTKENIKLADFPGFFDTRGTNYEIITNFSIDRAMDAFEGIPALVQVIPYENITADRAGRLFNTLKDLEEKFPKLFSDDCHPLLKQRIHFVITKFNQIGPEQLKARFEQLVNEYRADGLSGGKYFAFLLHQLLTGNVHLVNPLSTTKRIDIFNSIISQFEMPSTARSDPIKENYSGGFKEAAMQLRIGDVLHGAILCWNNLLKGFLDQKGEIFLIENRILRIDQQIQQGKIDFEEKSETLRQLKNKNITSFDPQDPLYATFEKSSKTTRQTYQSDISTMREGINALEADIERHLHEIENLELEITDLTTGSIQGKIYEYVIKKGDEQKFRGIWESHVDVRAKIRRQLDSGADSLSDHEGETTGEPHTSVAGTNTWTCHRSVVIKKQYELVPNHLNEEDKLKKLNELAGGVGFRSVILDDGSGWRINIESEGKIKFIDIKVHDSGKKFMYGYSEECDLNPPYPKLVITATLPKSVYNKITIESKRAEIEKLKNQNIKTRQQIALKQGTKSEYEEQLNKLETEFRNNAKKGLQSLILNATAQCNTAEELLKTERKELEGQKRREEEAKLLLRKFAVSINHHREIIEGTYTCSQGFRPVKEDHLGGAIKRKGEEVLEKCCEFAQLYESKKVEIEYEIEYEILRILN